MHHKSGRKPSRDEALAIKAEVDYQLLNKSLTDVTFIVGPPQHSKKYVGHRVLLAMTSPVFEAMFYGDMADKNKYIRVPDVAPIGFENLLRYAYTDSLNLGSVEDAMLTAYAAKKYLLPQLLFECLTFIETNICPASACVVYEFARVLNSQQLVLQATQIIDRQTAAVLSSKSFSHVQGATLAFVAGRKYLSIDTEFELIEATLRWCRAELRRRSLPSDDWHAARAILRQHAVLGALRFLALRSVEFASVCAQSTAGSCASRKVAGDAASGGGGTDTSSKTSGQTIIDVDEPNSLLTAGEQRAVLLNLAKRHVASIPASLCAEFGARTAPPDHFTVRRWQSIVSGSRSGSGSADAASAASLHPSSCPFVASTTTTRALKPLTSRFVCKSTPVFLVALTVPLRLEALAAAMSPAPSADHQHHHHQRAKPRLECHLKFTTTTPLSSHHDNIVTADDKQLAGTEPAQSMDSVDEALHVSVARDKDALVKLRRPILIRAGNHNELTLNFAPYALDDDQLVSVRVSRGTGGGAIGFQFDDVRDSEAVEWRFERLPGVVEPSELHYYK